MKFKKMFAGLFLLTSLIVFTSPSHAATSSVNNKENVQIQADQMEMTVVRYYTSEEARNWLPYQIEYAENGWYGTLTVGLKTWEKQPDGRYRVEYKGTVYLSH